MITEQYTPKLIAWEVTRRCHLKCRHCRAEAEDKPYTGELTTEECKKVLDNVASFAKPIIILTGGEPMCRKDIYEIAEYGNSLGLRMVMAPCGKLLDEASVQKMKNAGIKRISLSIDGATAVSHDEFRGINGSFQDILRATKLAKDGGLSFQINTTVTKLNYKELPQILDLVVELGADSFHPFLLVPTGRGKDLAGLELSPQEYEDILKWISKRSKDVGIHVKPTCAPHYFRIDNEEAPRTPRSASTGRPGHVGHGELSSMTRGCLGGVGFAFISHTGILQICGFLDVPCGDVREANYNFKKLWDSSQVFKQMRTKTEYKGKCGICEHHERCGGCRARAYALTGNYMMPEPFCIHQPLRRKEMSSDEILTYLQGDLPLVPDPVAEIAKKISVKEDSLRELIKSSINNKKIRRLSAVVSTGALGFTSALVAFSVLNKDVDAASTVIKTHPGVSHSYLREHEHNIWFTLKVPAGFDLVRHAKKLAKLSSAKSVLILPVKQTYKLDVRFDAKEKKGAGHSMVVDEKIEAVTLTETEMAVCEALNKGIEPSERPFKALADALSISEEEVLRVASSLREKGIIKKIRFVLNHLALGIDRNAMVVWNVSAADVDKAGLAAASKNYVSHCYERGMQEQFPYNLFTMVHASTADDLERNIAELASEFKYEGYRPLKTICELVKRPASVSSARYLEWEKGNLS